MALATVTEVQKYPAGDWNNPNGGYLYGYFYKFDNGWSGVAKHKTDAPRFPAGQQADVEVSGQYNGVNNLKVQRPQGPQNAAPPQGGQQSPPPAAQGPSRPSQPRQNGSGLYQGVTVGMAINNATNLIAHVFKDMDGKLTPKNAKGAIWKIASDILRVSEKLERGELFMPGMPEHEKPAQQAPAPPPPQPQAPAPNDVSQYEEEVPYDDSNVPF